jgi:hypothetical protein
MASARQDVKAQLAEAQEGYDELQRKAGELRLIADSEVDRVFQVEQAAFDRLQTVLPVPAPQYRTRAHASTHLRAHGTPRTTTCFLFLHHFG